MLNAIKALYNSFVAYTLHITGQLNSGTSLLYCNISLSPVYCHLYSGKLLVTIASKINFSHQTLKKCRSLYKMMPFWILYNNNFFSKHFDNIYY